MKTLGTYQIFILMSRALGFLRDALVFAILGATALSDDVFFLLGFTDLMTSIVAGGGAVLFLSLRLKEDFRGAYRATTVFYALVAVLFILSEQLTSAAFGTYIYNAIAENAATAEAYRIAVLGLVFTFPLVAAYAVFLQERRIYLQPGINLVYTLMSLLILSFFYFADFFSITLFAGLLLAGAVIRIALATWLALRKRQPTPVRGAPRRGARFYLEMFSSGLAIGVLVAAPFVFRGGLPSFGEGFYANAALAFKINDLVLAILIIPVTSLVLSRTAASLKQVLLLAGLAIGVSVSMVAVIFVGTTHIPLLQTLLTDFGIDLEIARMSILSFCFTSLAYTLAMVQVRIGSKAVLLALSLGLVWMVRSPMLFTDTGEIPGYFANMYISYTVFIGMSVVVIALSAKKFGAPA